MAQIHRVAIVTGASRGLGRAIAIALGAKGYALALSARDRRALEAVAEEAEAAGAPAARVFPSDLSTPLEPGRVTASILRVFGRIDALVNNAGDTKRGDFLELTDEDHLSGFALKYHATVRFCRAAWTELEKTSGSIVNISGIGAHTPGADFTVGGPVNSAIINFSKAISRRPGGPRVNVVCPGHIETDRLARRIATFAAEHGLSEDEARVRMREKSGLTAYGQPEDIASMVCYLCSDEARYIDGATFTVDGGATTGI